MRGKGLTLINVLFPLAGIGLMVFYEACDTSCAYLQGTFAGVDLKVVGVVFMAALLALIPFSSSRFSIPAGHLRTMMLAGALGGETLLVRFQIVHEQFCPFCLAFGVCVVCLFAANFSRMNKLLVGIAFLAGIGAFLLFFKGSVIPLYT
jgi:hypothetical protein